MVRSATKRSHRAVRAAPSDPRRSRPSRFVDYPWLSDFAANVLVRFDPSTERFTVVPLPSSSANVRQLLGRPGEVWGAESGVDKLVVVRTL
jgi:streptogramin lyase